MKRLIGLVPLWIPLLVLVAVLIVQLQYPSLFLTLRNFVFDGYQHWQPRQDAESPVIIVDIDDASLKRLGQWPWPRTKMASLVERVEQMGASAIALALLLTDPDRSTPNEFLSPHFNDPAIRRLAELLPDHDDLLAESIAKAPVAVGFYLSPIAGDEPPPVHKAGFAFAGPDPTAHLPSFEGAICTLPRLVAAAQGNGALNFIPGLDGRVRRVPFLIRHKDGLYPSLAAEALRLALDRPSYTLKSLPGKGDLLMRVGKTTVPLNSRGELWIHYARLRPEQYIPAWRIFDDNLETDIIHNAIVLIGASASGLADRHMSPLGDSITGVEIHLQVVEQVLNQSFLSRPSWGNGAEIVVQVLLGLALIALVAYAGAVWGALLVSLSVAAAFSWSAYAFAEHGWLLDPLSGSATLLAVYIVALVTRYIKAEKERRWIQRAFSSYVSPNLVQHLIQHPEDLRLGGERRECSFVLTDLADFTPLIEGSDPAELTSLINEYIDRMTAIAFAHDGTLDRIVGDAVAVMFSAPVAQPNHAQRAVACALAMDEFAHQFKKRKRAEGLPIGETRIGVHSGMVIVGNFGGSSQLDYRALGDAINTASRLEGANKFLGTRVCVSGATVRQCPGFTGRPVGVLHLKGKAHGIEAFEPVTPSEERSRAILRYQESYRSLEQDDGCAERLFAILDQEFPHDPLIRFHLRRLREGERGTTIVFQGK